MSATMFTRNELLLIEGALSPTEIAVEHDLTRSFMPTQKLCLRVGEALARAIGQNEAELLLSEDECWMLRERVRWSDSIGSDMCGLTLKRKLYDLLDELQARELLGDKQIEELRKRAECDIIKAGTKAAKARRARDARRARKNKASDQA